MNIRDLHRLRSWLLRRRNRTQKAYTREVYDPMNLRRARLDGQVTEADAVLDKIERMTKAVQDRFHQRRAAGRMR